MRSVEYIFIRDLKRLAQAPAAWLVLIFLLVLPSLYAWLNITAFWDPYSETSHLKIYVVNEDEGVENETLGSLNLGDQVVSQLQENDQLGWTFSDYGTAMDELNSGNAYAAFIIPNSFSSNIATILTDNFNQPTITYYVNEKSSPISPKITDVGASTLDATINDAFFSTVSMKVAEVLNQKIDEGQITISSLKGSLVGKLDNAITGLAATSNALTSLSDGAAHARTECDNAQARISDAKVKLDTLSDQLAEASRILGETNTALVTTSSELSRSLDTVSSELTATRSSIDDALSRASIALAQAKDTLEQIANPTDEVQALIDSIDAAVASLNDALSTLDSLAAKNQQDIDTARDQINTTTVPALSQSLVTISTCASALSSTVTGQKILADQLASLLDQLKNTLGLTEDAFSKSQDLLSTYMNDLEIVRTDIAALQAANTLEKIFGPGQIDPEVIAGFMQSPTRIETEILYPVNSFGSAMAPLFINLTLWIGIFMLMVIIRLEVDPDPSRSLTIAQRYFGRFILLAILGSLQAVVCCTGCLALGIQMENALLFYVTAVIAALSYLAIQYALSTLLQHVGKAICIILVFVQIPGATGLYPIEMTPSFFQTIYPLFPFTYGINALRETICGFYDGTWIHCIGSLILFFVLFIVAGAALKPALVNINRMFARELNEAGLINSESVMLPARRYHVSEILKALKDREAFKEQITIKVNKLVRSYPRLKRGALLVSIVILIAITALLAFLSVGKAVILTVWLSWFALIVLFFIALEYVRDYLSHLVSLEDLSTEDMKTLVRSKAEYTAVKPLKTSSSVTLLAAKDKHANTRMPENESVAENEMPHTTEETGGER